MPMMTASTEITDHVIVVAFGPASVTKAAVKRARRLVQAPGQLILAAANEEGGSAVKRLAKQVDHVAEGYGSTAVDSALTRAEGHKVLLVHDDVSITAEALGSLRDANVDPTKVVAVGNQERVGAECVFGSVDQLRLLRPYQPENPRWLLDSNVVIVSDVTIQHSERCHESVENPLLAASLIVRDEEALLPDCLASLDGLVDRIVVCDTGSSDRTMEIASEHGALVIQRPWTDDFSEARNAALAECRDAEFVLWIDADERLAPCDVTEVRGWLQRSGDSPDAYAVEVESTRSDGPTSIGLLPRLFRPQDLSFEGAIHEELRRADGAAPQIDAQSMIRLLHLGYDGELVALDVKAERNLSIARTSHLAKPTAKSALDYARSLALAGEAPELAIGALDEGLAVVTDMGRRVDLLAAKAGLELEMGSIDDAYRSAGAALDLAHGHDVAAAVFATAAVQLGHDEELVESVRQATGTSGIQVPRNRGLSLALAAGAALRMGDRQLSREFLEQASAVLSAQQERLEILLDASTDTDLVELVAALDCLGESPEDLVTAANRVWDESRAGEFARLSRSAEGPEQPATEPLGITISFGVSPVPGDEDLLLEWIPPNRRVLTWIGSDSFVERLGSSSSELTATDSSGLADQLEELIAGGNTVDVAVGGVGDDECDTILALLRKVMDPAGLVVLWDVDASGYPRTASVAVGIEGDELLNLSRLRSHGFMPETSSPPLVVAARPEWDEQSLVASRTGPFVGTVRVVSDQPIPDQLQLAYRASIPGHMAVEFDSSDSPDRPDLVLVTDHTLMPDPAWIQALIDDHGEHSEPVGARVIDRNGDVVRAGLTADARVIGLREEGSAPIMVSLRTRTHLGVPFVLAGDEDGARPPVGRLLGSPVAVTFEDSAESGAGVGLREMFDAPVLLLGGPAPGREHPDETAVLEKLFDRLVHRGITPVYQWAELAMAPEPFALQRWRSKGVVCFAPSSYFRDLGWFTPDPVQPRSDALVSALSPVAVAYLSAESLQFDFEAIAGRAGMARSFYTGVGDKLSERVDVKCTLAELADELCDSAEIESSASPSKIPVIAPVDHKVGLVSIVIPVYDRWDLTEVCLESISVHTPQPYEIIVVDNGSTDQTSRGLRKSDVSVIVNETNLGFPMAVNQGIQAARGEYVCVLNNDTEVTDGWLESMLEALAVPGTGMVGPRSNRIAGLQRVIDAPLLTDRTAAITWAKDWKRGCEALNWRVNRLIGFCLVARRDLFERLGGFDEGFGIGNFEDDDLGRRVIDSGLSLRVADGSVVLHHGGATFTSAEMDYPALIHESARHLSDDVPRSGLAAALILSDSNPVAAASSAATAAQIADHVRIVERGALASTELAAAALPGSGVTVVSADWTEDDGAAGAVEDLGASVVLVLGSTEQVDIDEWGAARAEIESFGQDFVEVIVGTSAEVRLVPTSAEAIAAVGSSSGVRARTFRVT